MDSELFKLCEEVYRKTDWGKTKFNEIIATESAWFIFPDKSNDVFPYKVRGNSNEYQNEYPNGIYIPAYNSDYLLEKLPRTVYGVALALWAGGSKGWIAEYDGHGLIRAHGDTPLKSLLKLTIALHEAGELS